jgi:hypothetical protein
MSENTNKQQFQDFLDKINQLQQMHQREMETLTKEREKHSRLKTTLHKGKLNI